MEVQKSPAEYTVSALVTVPKVKLSLQLALVQSIMNVVNARQLKCMECKVSLTSLQSQSRSFVAHIIIGIWID